MITRVIPLVLLLFFLEMINEPIIAGGTLDVKKKIIVFAIDDTSNAELFRIIIVRKPGANNAAIKSLVFVAQKLRIRNVTTQPEIETKSGR
jgi:hypothetical protein